MAGKKKFTPEQVIEAVDQANDKNQRWRNLKMIIEIIFSLAALAWAYVHLYVWVRSPQDNWESLTKLIKPQSVSEDASD